MTIQIADELAMLTQQRASGALEVGGNPGGTVFLSGGYLTFAESPVVPDLRSRLICSQRLTADQWEEVIEGDHAHGGVGALLVSRGIVTRGELRDLLRSIALDVLVTLAVPPSAEPHAVSVRFWPRRSHWIGSLLRLDITSVLADAGQKAALLARHNLRPEVPPRLCDLNRPWAVARPGPWAIAWQIDGQATVKDLAWRNGFALCDTMEWVGELVQAGLCTLSPPAAGPSAITVPIAVVAPAVAAPATAGAVREEPDSHERKLMRYRPRLGERRTRRGAEADRPGKSPQLESRPSPGISLLSPEPADGAVLASALADGAGTLLPQRKPGAALAARSARAGTAGVPLQHPEVIQPAPEMPRVDLLRRILRGLKRID